MSVERLRGWWSRRQGLDGSLLSSEAAAVLMRTGWARSVGGCSPYLTLWSRAGLSRAQVDRSISDMHIHELPAARGCTYVVPVQHYRLALRLGVTSSDAEMNVARKLGVTDQEMGNLNESVLRALHSGPLSPEELRDKVGDATRSLGAQRTKKGISTTLPLALGKLQAVGAIRRIPINGRLDQQRYRYSLWNPQLTGQVPSFEDAYTELACLYFSWIGPALPSEFQWFSGLGVKAAKAAMAPLQLVDVGNGRLLHIDQVDEYRSFQVPVEPHYSLVGSLDAMFTLRREVGTLLDPVDQTRPAVKSSELSDLASNAILNRGRIVGLWDFDTTQMKIVYSSFIPRNGDLEKAVLATEQYIVEDLGDARTFSLDSPKSRLQRIEMLRQEATV